MMNAGSPPSNPAVESEERGRQSIDFASAPEAEAQRLAALYRYDILDTEPEEAFDRITKVAAHLFEAPLAFVSLIDEDRQWMKSCVGLETREIDLDASICVYAIQTDEVTVIPDATEDERVADNPFVTGEAGIRFYAGAPLRTSGGYRIGTLCVLDTEPRPDVNPQNLDHLQNLAGLVVDELELRREVARRKRREEELEEARNQAEAARVEAEEANETMSRFFAGVAHDLQNPLTSILMLTELLKTLVSDKALDYVNRVRRAGQRMQSMTDSLMELSRLRSGTLSLDTTAEDVVGIAHDAHAAAVECLEAQGREAVLDLPDTPIPALVDAGALRRVLENLLGNAFKHTRPTDAVYLRVRQPGSDAVEIDVADDGEGIAPELLETLFDPFTRGDNDTEGVGLGLAIAQDLTEAMGGRIEVASEPGQGTRFRVSLPAA